MLCELLYMILFINLGLIRVRIFGIINNVNDVVVKFEDFW